MWYNNEYIKVRILTPAGDMLPIFKSADDMTEDKTRVRQKGVAYGNIAVVRCLTGELGVMPGHTNLGAILLNKPEPQDEPEQQKKLPVLRIKRFGDVSAENREYIAGIDGGILHVRLDDYGTTVVEIITNEAGWIKPPRPRADERVPYSASVRIFSSGGHLADGQIEDISTSGVRISTALDRAKIQQNARIQLDFTFENYKAKTSVLVTRYTDNPMGIGCKFQYMPPELETLVQDYVAKTPKLSRDL